jgi:hypothetical protein
MAGTWHWRAGNLIDHSSNTKRSADFISRLEQLDRLDGSKPSLPCLTLVVLTLDNGPIRPCDPHIRRIENKSAIRREPTARIP